MVKNEMKENEIIFYFFVLACKVLLKIIHSNYLHNRDPALNKKFKMKCKKNVKNIYDWLLIKIRNLITYQQPNHPIFPLQVFKDSCCIVIACKYFLGLMA